MSKMTAETPDAQRNSAASRYKGGKRGGTMPELYLDRELQKYSSDRSHAVVTTGSTAAATGIISGGSPTRPRAYSMHTKVLIRREKPKEERCLRRNSLPTAVLVQNFLSVPGFYDMTDKGDQTDSSSNGEEQLRRAKSVKEVERSGRRHEPLRRVRSFKTTSKGLINRGDSFKKKTTSSTGFTVTDINSSSETWDQCLSPSASPGIRDQSPIAPSTSIPTVSIDTKHLFGHQKTFTSHYRVLILGTPGVGKSSITDQFMTSEFLGSYDYSISQSEEDRTVTLLVDGDESTLEFLDENDFEDELESFSLDAYAVVYSLTDKSSFDTAADILDQLQQEVGGDKPIILVGNKSDLVRKRKVNADDGRAKADQYGCKYIETSAALNHRVDELLVGILKQILLKNSNPSTTQESSVKERKGSFKKTKHFIEKLFRRNTTKDKTCENLYVT